MAEIQLTCPGCAAEYRVEAGAIPPRGREVECTACGRIWHATRPETPARDRLGEMTARAHEARDRAAPKGPVRTIPVPPVAPAQPAAPQPAAPQAAVTQTDGGPRLNRPLPPDVLAILTEEADRERTLRAGEADARPVTVPEHAAPPDTPPPVTPKAPAPEAARLTPREVPVPTPYHAPDPVPRRGGGAFWWGLAIPLLLLALYLLSGAFPPDHPVTQALAPVRAALDHARAWLAGLTG